MPVEVIDTHTHVVSSDGDRYPVSPGVEAEQGWHRDHPVDTEALLSLADAAGVRAIALVQAISCYGFDNRYVLDSARNHPQRTIAIGALRPDDPNAVEVLRRDVTEGGARGVRLFSFDAAPSGLEHPAMRPLMAAAADLDIPVVILTGPGQLAAVLAVAKGFPSVRMVLDHCGFADLGGDDSFPHAGDLFALADFHNLHLKVSSMTLRATSYPEVLWSTLVSRFGSERLMWGSDYPHTNEPTYAALVDLALATTAGLSDAARTDVLSGTARRLWPGFG